VGGAFVANLLVCYFLWGLSGAGSGTSVTIFHAGQWLDYGNVQDRFRACMPACTTLCLQVNYKFQIQVALTAWPKLRLWLCKIWNGSRQQTTTYISRRGTAHYPSWRLSRQLQTIPQSCVFF